VRLDKFLGITGCCTRSEAKKRIRGGSVTVNGVCASSSDAQIDPERDEIAYCGKPVIYRKYTYIMMNKPEGVVSATEDGRDRTVLDLLPDGVRKAGLFPCGRLDKNTLGLILLTDNGELGHRLLAPKSHVEKRYYFRSKFPITEAEAARFASGLVLEDGYETKPAKIDLEGEGDCGVITLVDSTRSVFRASTEHWERFAAGDTCEVVVRKNPYQAVAADAEDLGLKPENRVPGKRGNVYFVLSEPAYELKDGDSGTVEFMLDARYDVLNVPADAISEADGRPIVYCLREDGMKAWKAVEIGVTINGRTEILSGLVEGEIIVVK